MPVEVDEMQVQAGFQLSNINVKVEGTDDTIIFSNLSVNQYLADVNSFSFTWRMPHSNQDEGFQGYVSFYKANFSKQVTISFGDGQNTNFTFIGFIYSINCTGQDDMGTEYNITGKGIFAKMDETIECNSFYKVTMSDIFTKTNRLGAQNLKLNPSNTDPLYYIVQYNQTNFDFLKMLAARYGEWFYYDGSKMVLGAPSGDAVTLTIGQDIQRVNIAGKIFKPSLKNAGFDVYNGKELQKEETNSSPSQQFMQAGMDGGSSAFGSDQTYTHVYSAATDGTLTSLAKWQQQASASNAMYISGLTENSKLALGSKIALVDEKGVAAGNYIIVQINHFCATVSDYQNNFVAVPAEIEVPPYTNAGLFPVCRPQPGIVIKNADPKGLGRLKVRLPWMQPDVKDTSLPWVPMTVPHAGKDKGFHFLPEENEEVMVGFMNDNAERPFVIGAFYTENGKHGFDPSDNNLKVIGTKSGRSIQIDDNKGTIKIADFTGSNPGNIITLKNGNDGTNIILSSGSDNQDFAGLALSNNGKALFHIMSGGTNMVSIALDGNSQKVTIDSMGSIEIGSASTQQISLTAGTINIKAMQDLNLEGTLQGAYMKGMEIDIEADTDLSISGADATISGDASLSLASDATASLQAGAMATIKGAIVMIN